MEKLNVYYYGEDRSNCGSCWERDDEDTQVLMTTLTLDEMKIKLGEHCNNQDYAWDRFQIPDFLSYVLCESEDEEGNINYPCIKTEISGTSYCPEIYGNIIGEDYDLEEELNPAKDVPNWKDLLKEWKALAIKRAASIKKADEKAKEKKKKDAVIAKEKKKKIAEKKEFEEYLKLRAKWESKGSK